MSALTLPHVDSQFANDESTAARCLALVWNCAPALMKQGGGALSETGHVTKRDRVRFTKLSARGMSAGQIAEQTGFSASTVKKYLQLAREARN